MAKKRVHEIAKAQGLSTKELLEKLNAAGIEAKAAASSVDEELALSALTQNGAGAAKARTPKASAKAAAPAAAPKPKRAAGPRSDAAAPPPPTAAVAVAEEAPAAPAKASAAAPPTAAAVVEQPASAQTPEELAAEVSPGETARAIEAGRSRPTRDSRTGEQRPGAVGPGGRRRVVIDSQASRRQAGGPAAQPVRRPPRRGRRRRGTYDDTVAPIDEVARGATDLIRINSGSTVKDVAEYFGVPVPEVIRKLMSLGEMATLTQTLTDEAITVLAAEFSKDIEIVHAADELIGEPVFDDEEDELEVRPPVVTIMGHVDHGKTSLLDAIRETEVAKGEAGGITQHIGAYQVRHNGNAITFLDTPGHEAFTAMRARGARVTDIAVIVVAADDGAKPQTDEAIDHARAADVPIIVAVNKIDKEGADPTRVRTEMTQRGLQPAEWGGDVEFVDVSARTRQGLDELLDTIQVVADLEELRANSSAAASGVVIESRLDPGRGPVVTLLVQRGTLEVGDALVAGAHFGRVRAMHDFLGVRTKSAGPGEPIEVLGFDGVPEAGDYARVVENERRARQLASERANRLKTEALARRSGRKISLEDVFRLAQEGAVKELNLVLKGDVSGSVEAVEDEIAKLPQSEVSVNIIRRGVGGINESDVMLAAASDAVILAFNVRPVGDARALAEREGVEIRGYSVIYRAIDELRAAMQGMLEPEEVEETVGQVEVRQTFRASRIGTIAGSFVLEGKVTRGAKVRIVRDGTVVNETTIASLRRFNEDVREVTAGFECGIVLANFQDIKVGDVLEVYETRTVERALA
ncbi:MAG TPA: translation initiation factor IF-2 [Solirubrobacteraceae bacterium]|nr:translation initiation factor IF-2 [Solirubrobacteraceae bacterium]